MALQLSPLPIILLIVQVLSRPNSGSHSWWEILPVLVMSSPEDRISHTFSLSSSQYIPSAHSYQCPCSLAGSGWGSEGMGRQLISIEFRVKNSIITNSRYVVQSCVSQYSIQYQYYL